MLLPYDLLISPAIPKLLPFAFGDEPSFIGDSTTVQCAIISGDLPFTFKWFLNDKPLDDHFHGVNVVMIGKKTSVLTIDSLEEIHAGNYTCIATNRAGQSTHSAELIVKGTLFL